MADEFVAVVAFTAFASPAWSITTTTVVAATATATTTHGVASSTASTIADTAAPSVDVAIAESESRTRRYKIVIPIFLAMSALGVLANAIVILALRATRVRNATVTLILSLTISDIWTSSVVAFSLLHNSYLPIVKGTVVNPCFSLTLEMLRTGGLITGILHLLLIAIHHYVGIVRPYSSKRRLKRMAQLLCALAWLSPSSVLFALALAFPNDGYWNCENVRFYYVRAFRYSVSGLLTSIFIIITTTYIRLLRILRAQQEKWRRQQLYCVATSTTAMITAATTTSSANSSRRHNHHNHHQQQQLKKQKCNSKKMSLPHPTRQQQQQQQQGHYNNNNRTGRRSVPQLFFGSTRKQQQRELRSDVNRNNIYRNDESYGIYDDAARKVCGPDHNNNTNNQRSNDTDENLPNGGVYCGDSSTARKITVDSTVAERKVGVGGICMGCGVAVTVDGGAPLPTGRGRHDSCGSAATIATTVTTLPSAPVLAAPQTVVQEQQHSDNNCCCCYCFSGDEAEQKRKSWRRRVSSAILGSVGSLRSRQSVSGGGTLLKRWMVAHNRRCKCGDCNLNKSSDDNNHSFCAASKLSATARTASMLRRGQPHGSCCQPNGGNVTGAATSSSAAAERRAVRENRTLWTTILICSSFFLGWAPATVLFTMTCDTCHLLRDVTSQRLLFVFSCVQLSFILGKTLLNPLIYSLRIPEVDAEIRAVLRHVVATLRRRLRCLGLATGGASSTAAIAAKNIKNVPRPSVSTAGAMVRPNATTTVATRSSSVGTGAFKRPMSRKRRKASNPSQQRSHAAAAVTTSSSVSSGHYHRERGGMLGSPTESGSGSIAGATGSGDGSTSRHPFRFFGDNHCCHQ